MCSMRHDAPRWPAGLSPAECPIHTVNERTMTAPIEHIWAHLIRAVDWPRWYPNARRVVLADGGTELTPGAAFVWTTFGVRVRTRITELEPMRRLAWEGTGMGSRGYHGWILEPRGESCHIITEETQRGLFVRLGKPLLRRSLLRYHQIWLERLDERAGQGPAAGV